MRTESAAFLQLVNTSVVNLIVELAFVHGSEMGSNNKGNE